MRHYYHMLLAMALSGLFACNELPQTEGQAQVDVQQDADSVALAQAIANYQVDSAQAFMQLLFGNPKFNIRSIGILVYDGVNDLDVTGPLYVLGQSMGAQTRLIGVDRGAITTVSGASWLPQTSIDSVNALDVLIVPGGLQGTIALMKDDKVLRWIQKIDQTSVFTAGVCTGGWVLGAAGLLKNKKASTHWYKKEEMLTRFGAKPVQARFVQDGKYWTSAGVTAGMDMSLAMMQAVYGDRYAQAIMLDMEYDPAPPITGGTPEKTHFAVRWMMQNMYDASALPLLDSLKAQ